MGFYIIWVILIQLCMGLVCRIQVYDCESGDLNYTSLSLIDLPKCHYGVATPKREHNRRVYNATSVDGGNKCDVMLRAGASICPKL